MVCTPTQLFCIVYVRLHVQRHDGMLYVNGPAIEPHLGHVLFINSISLARVSSGILHPHEVDFKQFIWLVSLYWFIIWFHTFMIYNTTIITLDTSFIRYHSISSYFGKWYVRIINEVTKNVEWYATMSLVCFAWILRQINDWQFYSIG